VFKFERDNVPNEDELWWVSHLAQTRFLPAPSKDLQIRKTADFINGTQNGVSPSEREIDGAYELGQILAYEARMRRKKVKIARPHETHLSLSSGSCWEASRADLGKWHLMMPESELNEYLDTPVYLCNFRQGSNGDYFDTFDNLICNAEDEDEPLWKIAYLNRR
jgi:hypothetical protein